MTSRTLPGLGLKAFFNLGEDGWKDDFDLNILKLSVLVQGKFIDIVDAEPEPPTEGSVYVLSHAHLTHPDEVIVYDDSSWKYLGKSAGWEMFNLATGTYYNFIAGAWSERSGGGSSAPTPPVVGATDWIDFTSGTAYLGGTVVTDLSTLFTNYDTGRASVDGYTVAHLDDGLEATSGALVDLVASISANMSVMVDFSRTAQDYKGYCFAAETSDSSEGIEMYVNNGGPILCGDYVSGEYGLVAFCRTDKTGRLMLANNPGNGQYSSYDGHEYYHDTANSSFSTPVTKVTIGADAGLGNSLDGTVRFIAFFAGDKVGADVETLTDDSIFDHISASTADSFADFKHMLAKIDGTAVRMRDQVYDYANYTVNESEFVGSDDTPLGCVLTSASAYNYPQLIGDFATKLKTLTNTVVIEWIQNGDPGSLDATIMKIQGTDSLEVLMDRVSAGVFNGSVDKRATGAINLGSVDMTSGAKNRIAYTVTGGNIRASLNGGTVVTQSASFSFGGSPIILLGSATGTNVMEGTITLMEVYNATESDGTLQTLSDNS